MGGKSKSAAPAPAPVAERKPDETIAQEAAARALAAQGDVNAAQSASRAEEEDMKRKRGEYGDTLGGTPRKTPRRKRDVGSVMGATSDMQQSAVLTG